MTIPQEKLQELLKPRPKRSTSSPFSTAPEEIRQEIISYLDYNDAWSLKQTSRQFHNVVEIPTIASFIAYPYGPSLAILEDWAIIPFGHEFCNSCHRLLSAHHFSRFQRWVTTARQKSGTYDYDSYKPKHHFCIDCAFKSGEYKRGEIIYTGFGDPGSIEEAIAQCYFCGVINTVMQPCFVNCEACKKCFVLMGNKREVKLEFSVDHEPILEIPFALGPEALGHYLEDAMTARMEFRLKGDPVFSLYDEYEPEDLLRIVGEKLLEEDEDEWDAGGFCVGGLHCPNAAE